MGYSTASRLRNEVLGKGATEMEKSRAIRELKEVNAREQTRNGMRDGGEL